MLSNYVQPSSRHPRLTSHLRLWCIKLFFDNLFNWCVFTANASRAVAWICNAFFTVQSNSIAIQVRSTQRPAGGSATVRDITTRNNRVSVSRGFDVQCDDPKFHSNAIEVWTVIWFFYKSLLFFHRSWFELNALVAVYWTVIIFLTHSWFAVKIELFTAVNVWFPILSRKWY